MKRIKVPKGTPIFIITEHKSLQTSSKIDMFFNIDELKVSSDGLTYEYFYSSDLIYLPEDLTEYKDRLLSIEFYKTNCILIQVV